MSERPPPSLVPPVDPFPSSRKERVAVPAAPSSRSLPPTPVLEPILDTAVKHRDAGDWDGALEAYKKALFLIGSHDVSAQASLYASVAEVKIAQDKPREAETNFEKALAAKPKHMRSLEGLVKIATEAKEWSRVVTYRQKLAEALDDEDDKAAELNRVADILERDMKDPKRAAEVLERAKRARADDTDILHRLRGLYESMRAWPKVIDTLHELCKKSERASDRASFRFQQADTLLARLRDEPRGLALLELALDEDPQHDRALSATIALRTRREEWAELASVYERLIDRFAGLGDRERAWEVTRKLGALRRDKLLDGPGAMDAFRGAVELRPEDAETRASLAELYANKGDRSKAVTELETVAMYSPLRAQTYRRLYDLHVRAQRPDRAWLVATCLEELGAADVAHELMVEQFRPEGPIRPTTALDESWWDECLRARGADPILAEILRIVSDAAIAIRLEDLTAKKKLPKLDEESKQAKTSTASVVRTFVWAARALGIALPDLYLREDVPTGIAAIPAPTPTVAIGPQVRSNITVKELSFLAGRHLTYYRPEHYPLVLFPTLAEISSLVLTAVRIVIPGISTPPPSEGSERVTRELGGRITDDKKKALEAAVKRLDARGGRLDVFEWIRHVELTANRAGLLLAGDLRVALRILKTEERPIAEMTEETKRGDLLGFCASEAYGLLRERMGVALFSSTPGEEGV